MENGEQPTWKYILWLVVVGGFVVYLVVSNGLV